jgi:hypothetical protein
MTNPFSAEDLEQRAASQRQRLQESVSELRSTVRERLDVQKVARTYIWQASATVGLLALAAGYAVASALLTK